MIATQLKSVPSPTFGSHDISHWTDLQFSQDGNLLEETTEGKNHLLRKKKISHFPTFIHLQQIKMVSFNTINSTKENFKSSQQHSIIELMLTWKKKLLFQNTAQRNKPEDQKRLIRVAGIKGFKHQSLPAEKNQVLLNGKIHSVTRSNPTQESWNVL